MLVQETPDGQGGGNEGGGIKPVTQNTVQALPFRTQTQVRPPPHYDCHRRALARDAPAPRRQRDM